MNDQNPVNLRCSAVVFRGESVLLCRRSSSEDTWVLPGGTPRAGEGSAMAARREVAEETGLQIETEVSRSCSRRRAGTRSSPS
jgi:8-oxo-dGTP diphosphatase